MTTPPEVQTSVTKCLASASKAMERCTLAAPNITQASKPFSAELATDKAKPQPSDATGWGSNKRCAEAQMMAAAAPTMSTPSKPEEKYSALW